MIKGTIRREAAAAVRRLDAWYHLAPGAAAARQVGRAKARGLPTVTLGGPGGLGRVWMPGRLKQVMAAPGEPSRPYVKPHDVFQYLPEPQSQLSIRNTENLTEYALEAGWMLQTRSGRNLGLNALVDADLAQYVASDDLIRIAIPDERLRFYATAFLRTRTGYGLLRRDKSGSVIDHLSTRQVESIEIPLVSRDVLDTVVDRMRRAHNQRESSRSALRRALAAYETQLPAVSRETPRCHGWGVRTRDFTLRLDAASYDPLVRRLRMALEAMGGVALREVAKPLKPPGRYRTIYVLPPHGLPFMSGTQVLQHTFSRPQYMSPRAFRDVEAYRLESGWSVYMADGRSELNLGIPALVTSARSGWLASGHVGRLVPKEGVMPVSLATRKGPPDGLCCHLEGTTPLPVMGPPRSPTRRSN